MEKNNLQNKELAKMLGKANELANGLGGILTKYEKGLSTIIDPELRDWITSKMREAKAGNLDINQFTVEMLKRTNDYKDKIEKENK